MTDNNLRIIRHRKNDRKLKRKLEIFLFDTHIAGTTYVEDIDKLAKKLNIGDRLEFEREEDNYYDFQAIKVINKDGHKLGYVPQRDNVIFARLIDHGKVLFARIRKIELKGKWYKIDISIFLEEGWDFNEDTNS